MKRKHKAKTDPPPEPPADYSDAAAAANPPQAGDWFDHAAADRVCKFFELFLTHTTGEFAGRPFILEPWQRYLLRRLFGWKRPDGRRRYRRAYFEIPRKNGKSTFAAGIALYLLNADGEHGAQIFSAAADKEQASIVFGEAKKMVDASPQLSARCATLKTSIFVADTASSYRVLSKDAPTKHGLNPHGVVIDELHALPNRELFDVLTTAQGARRQPMTVMITTAGYDRNSVCWEQHDYACKVRDGIIDDPNILVAIYTAGERDDWREPATWRKANPNLGVSISEEFLAEECKAAQESPARENTFKRLYLNIWTEQATRWLAIEVWDEGAQPVPNVIGQPCWGGLDLSSVSDLTAFVAVFRGDGPGQIDVLAKFWVPKDNAEQRARRDRVPYPRWIREGLITATPGNVVDYDYIRRDLGEFASRYQLKACAYDPWQAMQVVTKLKDDGLPMVEHRQGFASMSNSTKTLETKVLGRLIRHGGHEVLRWMIGNVVVDQDAAGNLKPTKRKSQERIDGAVALIMALGISETDAGTSVYDNRGLVVL